MPTAAFENKKHQLFGAATFHIYAAEGPFSHRGRPRNLQLTRSADEPRCDLVHKRSQFRDPLIGDSLYTSLA